MDHNLGANLIFLISQPRAGSTMLQRILGNHPQIHTISEPWIMLHPLYALKDEGYWFDYDGQVAGLARIEFLRSLPHGEEDYYEGLRGMYSYLYRQALSSSGKEMILDKTPRYYNIIPELKRLFPEAHFIFLIRNPLAVLNSILETWIHGSWFLLHRYKLDLLKAPHLIVEGIEKSDGSCIVVNYERLVEHPTEEINRILQNLDLVTAEDLVAYGNYEKHEWLHGDKSRVNQIGKPDPKNLEKWLSSIENPQVWRFVHDYLYTIGEEVFGQMGYAFGEVQTKILARKPNSVRLLFTYSLNFCLNLLDISQRSQVLEHRIDRVIELLKDVGIRKTIDEILKEVKRIRNEKREEANHNIWIGKTES